MTTSRSSELASERDGVARGIERALREQIYKGVLPAGTQLRQDHIAARFGSSHIPVREALRRLENAGLVTFYPRRGAFVAGLSAPEAREMVEMRAALESLAAKVSVPVATELDWQAARAALARGDKSRELDVWAASNWAFHRALYAPCRRPRLLTAIEDLWVNTDRYLRVVWQTRNYQPKSQDEHRAILDAFMMRDADRAATLVARHITQAGEELIAFFEEQAKA
jgi:DNA-binding GntR family transcriptional regulator